MYDVRDLCLSRDGQIVLSDITFCAAPGEVVLVTGPNGTGKSRLIRALSGLERPSGGRILWDGREVTGRPFHTRRGIALVPEGRLLSPSLTVSDNLDLGAGRLPRAVLRHRRDAVLGRFPILARRLGQQAGTLSGGEAQMLSFARALMSAPRLLLLDEPTLGLSPASARAAFETLAALKAEGMAMILTDREAAAAARLADQTLDIRTRMLRPEPHRNISCVTN